MHITIRRTRTVKVLVIITCLLIALSLLTVVSTYALGYGRIYGLIPLLNLDHENNIPTMYSFVLLVASGLLFLLIGSMRRADDPKAARKFRFLGFLFFYLGIDEISSIHELLTEPMKELGQYGDIFYHAWVIVVIPLLVLLAVYLWRFYFNQPKELKIGLAMAAVVFITGALGFEMIEGWYAASHGRQNAVNALLANVEESLEVFGVIILIDTLLRFIVSLKKNQTGDRITISFE